MSRSGLYSFFSQLLDIPSKELLSSILEVNDASFAQIESFSEHMQQLLRAFFIEVKNEYRNFKNKDEYYLEILRDYTRMFHASRPRLVPPFESVYREKRLFGDSTLEVRHLYHAVGLEFNDPFNLPPDHMAYELEFMSYLCFQEEMQREESVINKSRELQRRMVCEHLAHFAPELARRLKQHSRTSFYKMVGQILEEFINQEINYLRCK